MGVTVPAAALTPWIRALFERAGLEADAAATVTGMLVETSLRGVDSHGIARVPVYVERLQAGVINPRPRPAIVSRHGALATVDGDHGPGQVAGAFATDLSIELAREHGAGVVAVRRSSHYGAAALYARRAAGQGLLAISMTNTEPLVIPYGGAGRALGTNPIALAAPTPDGIFDLDLATSQVAINRIYNARDEGRAIPDDWGVDSQGRPTTDPGQVHAAVPLGGYKGYALALLVEILCGVLPGAGVRDGVGMLYDDGPPQPQDVGHFHLALDPQRTVGRDRFAQLLGTLLDELRAIEPAAGFDTVLAPGDPEQRSYERRSREGVPVEPALWRTLVALSDALDVAHPVAA
jgi:LDH2 family malate/lactate/ureidoglycolate dehydrogenase